MPNTATQPTHQLNRVLLEQLHRCRQPQRRLHLRNQLVLANLGLVHRVAASQRGKGNLGYDDLVSVGCIGLIKAIETFEPQRGLSLSTVAVPFIRGAMQHVLYVVIKRNKNSQQAPCGNGTATSKT